MSEADTPDGAVGRAMRLLDALAAAPGPVALAELAAATGLPKATAHRLLLQLEAAGAVRREPDGKRFAPGDGLRRLARGVMRISAQAGPARDVMAALVAEIGETCNLGVLDGRAVLYVERVECDQPLRLHLRAGSRVPLHATAVGKLILAHMPPARAARLLGPGPLPALTPNTRDRAALLAQLPEIRRDGLSFNAEEATPGVTGVAAPVFAPDGALLAGLSIHAPLSRFDIDAARAAAPRLTQAAAEIAAALAEG